MGKLRDSIQTHIEVSNKCGVRIRSGIKSVIVGKHEQNEFPSTLPLSLPHEKRENYK